MGSAASSSSAQARSLSLPKLIIPRQMRDTRMPVLPRFTYSIDTSPFCARPSPAGRPHLRPSPRRPSGRIGPDHSLAVARSAPARRARSFSHTTDGAMSPIPAEVSKPQSVPAMTRRGSPTAPATRSRRSATTSGCST